MHVQPLTGAQLGGKGEASSTIFENQKNKCPDFGGKEPDCDHLLGQIFHSKYRFMST